MFLLLWLVANAVALCVAGNEVPQETVDAAAVFLFHLFAKDKAWSSHHAEEIRRSLGPFPTSAASNACNIVHEIMGLASEGWKYSVVQDDKLSKEFGHNIVFKYHTSAEPLKRSTPPQPLPPKKWSISRYEFYYWSEMQELKIC